MPGEAAKEGGHCTPSRGLIGRFQGGALRIEFGLADVGDGSRAFGQKSHITDRLPGGVCARAFLLEFGVALDVRKRRSVALTTNAAEAATQIENKGFPLLLAVGNDIDADLALLADHPCNGTAACGGKRLPVDGLASRATSEQAGQLRRPWQAAGVRRQDPRVALWQVLRLSRNRLKD